MEDNVNWSNVEANFKKFIAKMENYPPHHGTTAKNTLSEIENMEVDSARFYLENTLRYQYARMLPHCNNIITHEFSIGYFTEEANLMLVDDVNTVYETLIDSMSSIYANVSDDTKQLVDLTLEAEYYGNDVKFNAKVTIGTIHPYPEVSAADNITFANLYPNYPKWHWEDYMYLDANNVSHPTITNAFSAFAHLFFLRQQYNIYSQVSLQYMWIKNINVAAAISTPDLYISSGPPTGAPFSPVSHYYSGFPLTISGLLNVAYFMAGSNDFSIDNQQKTWLTTAMLDYYLQNFISLSSAYAPSSNYRVWEITPASIGNNAYNSHPQLYGPNCNGSANYLNYDYWRRWNLATYFAVQTPITLPAPTPF